MTDFSNNGKFVPKAPETYIVAELKDQEIKKSPLSAVARSKVINRSGSNYLSERTAIVDPSYGPANEDYLTCACPAKGCENTNIIKWAHASDNTRLKINKWATIWCTKSNCSTSGHMKEWEFACPNHETKFKKTSSLEFSKALFIACDGDMDSELLDELTKYLKKPENKW